MVLTLTAHYRPNLGGLETHLTDLEKSLQKRKIRNFVLTYKPLTTNTEAVFLEQKPYLTVLRIPWFPGFFYRLVSSPVLEFLYLVPGLFLSLPLVIISNRVNVIHAHGLVAGFAGVFWGRIFNKKVIISTHSIYNFPDKGIYSAFSRLIFSNCYKVLCLSDQSVKEIRNLGIAPDKISRFIYWVDTGNFRILKSSDLKIQFGLKNKFVVLFVGRLIHEKGIHHLIKAAKKSSNKFEFLIAGDGPLRSMIEEQARRFDNIRYLGRLSSDELPVFYNTADVLIVPSIAEEGFGRIILESLSCGTPVIGSKKGAIPEAIDESVGMLIDPNTDSIVQSIEYLRKKTALLKKFKQNSRNFALKRYSEKNVNLIIKHYE